MDTNAPEKFDFFISYASEQYHFAQSVNDFLKRTGFKVWFAPNEMQIGDKLRKKIKDSLLNCTYHIMIWSEEFFKKNWTMYEQSLVDEYFVKFFPIKIDNAKIPNLLPSDIFFIDYYEKKLDEEKLDEEELYEQLYKFIGEDGIKNKKEISSFIQNVLKILNLNSININSTNNDDIIKFCIGDFIVSYTHFIIGEFKGKEYIDLYIDNKDTEYLQDKNEIIRIIVINKNETLNINIEQKTKIKKFQYLHLTYLSLFNQFIPVLTYIENQKKFLKNKIDKIFIEPTVKQNNDTKINALTCINDWLNNENETKNFLILLGDLGTGKTTLSMKISQNLIHDFEANPSETGLPLYIDLNPKMINDTFEDLVKNHFDNNGLSLQPIQLYYFMSLFHKGFFTIIFDGFDFLADGMDWGTQYNRFQTFRPPKESKGKVLLTCRTHYFRSINEQNETISSGERTKLGDVAEEDDSVQIIYMQEFSEKQVLEYLKKNDRESDFKKIKEIYDFSDMSKRPLLLKFILKYMNKLKGKNDPTIVDLYQIYIDTWLKRDEVPSDRQIMTKSTKKLLMLELAWEMWNTGKLQIHYESLTNFLKKQHPDKKLEESHLEKILRNTMRASFLKRDEKGNFSFMHQSFMEYFVALNIYESASLKKSQFANLLKTKLFNSEINYFLSMLDYEKDHLVSNLNIILEQSYQEKISENALSILYHKARFNCGMHKVFDKAQADQMLTTTKELFPEKVRLSGANLQNMDLRGANLEKANLSQSDFSHSDLSYSNLKKAKLIGCNLTETKFIHANA